MPIYEYECKACGHHLEALQKISEKPLKSCPECHKDQLQKMVSAAGFQLKGTGWYKTDYTGSKSKDSGTDKKEGGKGGSSTSTDKSS